MVDTTDEWIMTRIGIKERRILRDADKGSAYLGARAVEDLFRKTGLKPEEVDLLICCTVTADMHFPANGNVISDMVGIKNAFSFDLNAGCSGFLYGLITATQYVESGRYKKVIVVGAEKMSAITDYTDRATCPSFGDAAAAGNTVAVMSPYDGRERRAMCLQIVAAHRSTTVDNRGYLLVFNNNLPKQHFRI